MGNRLLPHLHRKAQQRRALCLAQRWAAAQDRRSSRQPPRWTFALELATKLRQSLSHVQGMDACYRTHPKIPKPYFASRLSEEPCTLLIKPWEPPEAMID